METEAESATERKAEADAAGSNFDGRQRNDGQDSAARNNEKVSESEKPRGSGNLDARGDRPQKGKVETKADHDAKRSMEEALWCASYPPI
jgi:hypothetical protein